MKTIQWVSTFIFVGLLLVLGAIFVHRTQSAKAALSGGFDCTAVTEIPQAECEGLVAFYLSTNGDNWLFNSNWLETDTPCGWRGVYCIDNHVAHLTFSGNNRMVGPLPPEIGQLSELTRLVIHSNEISAIPDEIGNLTNLTDLNLYFNRITTAVPSGIGNLTNLTTLNLSSNQIPSIPAEIGNLSSLVTLDLSANEISEIPSTIGNLTALDVLELDVNPISSLPAEIGNLTNLTKLTIISAELTAVPVEIGNLTNLTSLNLSSNNLTSIPAEIGNLSNLTSLSLDNNRLNSLPIEIGNLHNLTRIYLSRNRIPALPDEISNLTNLWHVYVAENYLTALPTGIGQWVNLRTLHAFDNQLSELPAEIGNLTNLENLWLDNNQLATLPTSIGNLTDLKVLNLSENMLTAVPSTLGNLTNLTELHLNGNQLTAVAPALTQLPILNKLYLQNNPLLSGPLPVSFADMPILRYFYFHNTALCVPNDADLISWIDALYGKDISGFNCDQPTGQIAGTITDESGQPIPDIVVTLYRYTELDYLVHVEQTFTNQFGQYMFTNVGQDIRYYVAVNSKDNSFGTAGRNVAEVESGQTYMLDVQLLSPLAPLVTLDLQNDLITTIPFANSGILLVTFSHALAVDLPFIYSPNCDGDLSEINLKYNTVLYPMIAMGNGEYRGVIPASALDNKGSYLVEAIATCNGDTSYQSVAYLDRYVNPTGTVIDEITGLPVQGAKMSIYNIPWIPRTGPQDMRPHTCQSILSNPNEDWNQPAPQELTIWLTNLTNLIALGFTYTNGAGEYGLPIIAGNCYYITAEAPGYYPMTNSVGGRPSYLLLAPVPGNFALRPLHMPLYDNVAYLPLITRP